MPDTTMIGYDYDPNGNMTVLTNPRTISHGFDYTGVNLRRSMTTPMSGNYQYTYDKERNLKSILFPSGKEITNTYHLRSSQLHYHPGRSDQLYLYLWFKPSGCDQRHRKGCLYL